MTTVKINPGVCNFITTVEASSEDQMEVKVIVKSGCLNINKLFVKLGDTFDSYEICLAKPSNNVLYENLQGHAACPVIAGIIKCIEAECKLALPRDATITFENNI